MVGDVVTEAAGGGTDTVLSTAATYTLGAEIEHLTLLAGAVNGTGNIGNNTITGSDAANTLNGGGGNDTLVDNLGDQVQEGAVGGIDEVRSSANFTLGAEVENLVLLSGAVTGTGNGLANAITGNAAGNKLDGGGGNDTPKGGLGNDTYLVNSAGDVIGEGLN